MGECVGGMWVCKSVGGYARGQVGRVGGACARVGECVGGMSVGMKADGHV